MKPGIFFLVISTLLIFSCDDGIIPCDDLDWLDGEIQTLEQSGLSQFNYVSQAEYKGETVFIFRNCCPNCFSLPPRVYYCSGALIGRLGEDIDPDKLKNDEIYWQPDNFSCFQD